MARSRVSMQQMICKYKNLLIFTHSFKNRRTFLTNRIYKKVIPPSISNIIKHSDCIFPDYIRIYLETSIQNLKFSEEQTFDKLGYLDLN